MNSNSSDRSSQPGDSVDTTAPKLPEGLEPVAWQYVSEEPLDCGQLMLSEERPNRRELWPLVRLSDAQSALQAQAAEHATEIRRIRDIRNENAEDCRTEIRLCREEIAVLKEDATRYRVLRRKVCIAGGQFHILNLDPTYVAPDAAVELDAAIDSALLAAKEAK